MIPQPSGPRSRVADVALVVSFLAAIAAPLLSQLAGLDLARLDENRARAPRPGLTLRREVLAEYPRKFEVYFNDTFGLRDPLIRWNNLTRVSLLGISHSPKVEIGRRGWLYYLEEGAVKDLRRSHPLSLAELQRWAWSLEARRQWLASRGIRYLVLFAPNKHTIYPEYLPRRYDHVTPETRCDQIYKYLAEHTQLDLLDLREPLLKAKSRARLYHRRDTHWNDRGAFIGYREIMQRLSRWYPNLGPMPRSAFKLVEYARPNPDLSLMLGLGDVMPEVDYALVPRFGRRAHRADPGPGLTPDDHPMPPPFAFESGDDSLPRAVVFRDSFSIALIPLLAEHFSRSLYLWHCPFDPTIIEREKPQVVIEEAVERRLWAPPPLPNIPDAMIAQATSRAK
jgi:alginate O-acetyltransferase complex protein AlgJ